MAKYDSAGHYGRQKPGGGAKNFYNRFKCAGGLLWFAEALGVPAVTLRTAISAVSGAPRNPASQCGAFRAVVPWATITPLLKAQVNAAARELPGSIGHTVTSAARTALSALSAVSARARAVFPSGERDPAAAAPHLPLAPAEIDVTFDFRSDTPPGRDPDSHSPTLRRYHKLLWSKPLPDGTMFTLTDDVRGAYLLHESKRGRIALSSDSIINASAGPMAQFHTAKSSRAIRDAKGSNWGWTIGAAIVFPGYTVDRKPTINGARGMHPRIADRFDLTLECICRHYVGETDHPLSAVLARYDDFFELFESFASYTEFFFLQDLVGDDGAVRFYVPFDGFDKPALSTNLDGYLDFLRAQADFASRRSRRIDAWCHRTV